MRSWAKRISDGLAALCLMAGVLLAPAAIGADISLRNPVLDGGDEGYTLSADFNVNFNTRLEEVINKGVVLYFVMDFELTRSRWYWLDEHVVRRSRTFQLSYHALTRQYRLSMGSLHQGYATLDEALRVMSRLRNWRVIERNEVQAGQAYVAALRMYLDLTQMPKTFQVSALSSKDWSLTSEWQRWPFTPLAPSSPVSAGEAK